MRLQMFLSGIGLFVVFLSSGILRHKKAMDIDNIIPEKTAVTDDSQQNSKPTSLHEVKENQGPEQEIEPDELQASPSPPDRRTIPDSLQVAMARRLLGKEPMEVSTWLDARTQRLLRVSLVRDDDAKVYIVKEPQVPDNHQKLVQTSMQIATDLIVHFKNSITEDSLLAFTRQYDLSLSERLLLPNTYVFVLGTASLSSYRKRELEIAKNPLVSFVDGNYLAFSSAIPNDPLFASNQWGLLNDGKIAGISPAPVVGNDLKISKAWDTHTDCSKTVVAILDSGVDFAHPDLIGNLDADASRNFVSGEDPKSLVDTFGHGTHVAGTVGAIGNNGTGVTGVCWKAKMISIRVLGTQGSGPTSTIVNGLAYAADSAARIVNASLGWTIYDPTQELAMQMLRDKGKILVAAAGNNGVDVDVTPEYPGSFTYTNIVNVANLNGNFELNPSSNYGIKSVDIGAPGTSIYSTFPTTPATLGPNVFNYAFLTGTSMAAPHVAGMLALLTSYAPNLTNAQAIDILFATADTKNFVGRSYGKGQIGRLDRMFERLKPRASIVDIEEIHRPTPGTDSYVFTIDETGTYSALEKVEIYRNGKLLTTASRENKTFSLRLKPEDRELNLTLKITDAAGRTSTQDLPAIEIEYVKVSNFVSIDLADHGGLVVCSLDFIAKDGSAENLYKASVDTNATCEKICSFIVPLTYSSQRAIRCGVPGGKTLDVTY